MQQLSTCADIIPFIYFLSLMVILIIGAVEGLLTILGFGMSSILDEMFPSADIDIDLPDTGSYISEGLTWMNKGRVPSVMLFLIFIMSFGLIGSIIHCSYHSFYLIASIPISIVGSVFVTRLFSTWLGKIMPKIETTAVSTDSFIGNVATITMGTATNEKYVEASTEDIFGKTHYLMARAEEEGMTFKQNTEVIISKKLENGFFTVIAKD